MFHALYSLSLLAESVDPWASTFFGLDQDNRFVLMLVTIGCVTGVICTVVSCVSGAVNSIHRRRLDHELKQDLLDRGMTAEEVARVVESSPPNDFLDRWAKARAANKRCPPGSMS